MRLRILSACLLVSAALGAGGEEPAATPLLEIPEPERMTLGNSPFEANDDIRAIAWSPRGHVLAVCDAGSGIALWAMSNGGVWRSWTCPDLDPGCIAWSSDGRFIAAGGREEVVVWEAESGKEVRRIRHGRRVVAVAFTTMGRTLISATANGELRRTDMNEEEPPVVLSSPAREIHAIAVSADGKRLAIAGLEPQVAILSLPEGKLELAFGPNEVRPATWVGWGPSDRTVITHVDLGPLQEFHPGTGVVLDAYSRGWLEESMALAMSPDGRQVAAVNANGTVRARTRRAITRDWSAQVPEVKHPFAAVSPGGSWVAVPWGARRVRFLSMSGGTFRIEDPDPDPRRYVAWSPESATVFITCGAVEVHAFDAETGKRRRGYVAPGNQLLGLAARPDGALVAASFGGGWLRVTDVTSGVSLLRKPLKSPPAYAQLSQDGGTFAWRESEESDRFFLRDLLEPGELPSIRLPGKAEHSLGALSPQGDVFVQLDWARDQLLYSETTCGMPVAESGAPESRVFATQLLVSPDGTRTVVQRNWGALDLLVSGRPRIGALKGEIGDIGTLQFSPDGTRLAAVGDVCRILDASDLHQVTGFRIPGKGVALAWAPDGRRIAIVDDSGVTRIWAVPPPEPPPQATTRDPHLDWGELACQRADRAFAAAQRLQSGSAETVAFLREKLAERENPDQIRRLIAQLRDESFARRQAARDDLHWMGIQAEPELLRAMTGEPAGAWRTELELLVRTAEARVSPSSQNMRRQHAMQILESIGSADAADTLRHLSEESPSPRERQDAREALRRLEQRPSR